MDKKEIIRFVRTVAYVNIFTAPFKSTSTNIHTTAAISLASLAVLYLTD